MDGQYIKLNFGDHLMDELNLKFNISWDAMHLSACADGHTTDYGQHPWLVKLRTLCRELYTQFNWGQAHERFREAAEELGEEQFTRLKNFSETRFANSNRFVFTAIITDIRIIIKRLEEIIDAGRMPGAPKDIRDKADDAAAIKGRFGGIGNCSGHLRGGWHHHQSMHYSQPAAL